MSGGSRTRVLLVGSPHFMEWDMDFLYSSRVLSGLGELCARLAGFSPDRVILEANRSSQADLTKAYLALDCGDFDDPGIMASKVLGRFTLNGNDYPITFNNEGVLIGFRIAKMLNHATVYGMDYDLLHPFDHGIYGREGELADRRRSRVPYERHVAEEERLSSERDILGLFRHLNRDDVAHTAHYHHYLSLNELGAGEGYEGSDFLLQWYERNLKSLANLQDLCRGCERVMVLYGAGHLRLYKDFIDGCMNMEAVGLEGFLGGDRHE